MKKEIKQKWLDALRSSKYQQGQGWLCLDNKYCCLGVLAEELGILEEYEPNSNFKVIKEDDKNYNIVSLPEEMEKELEIENHIVTLIAMNDGGKPFTEIADWIEANIEEE